MGFIGKVLVLLHGAVALTVLAWAFGVVTNRIDWNTPPAETGKESTPGLYARQKTKADEYNVMVDRSYTRWTGNLNQVRVLEAERYPRRAFYGTHLYVMKYGVRPDGKGGFTPVPNPVQDVLNPPAPNGFIDVPRDKDGNLDLTQALAKPPFNVREKTMTTPAIVADSEAGYDKKMAKLVDDIKASQMRSATAITDRDKLNKEIVGVTQPTLVKGLRTLITEQKTIMDQAEAEDRYVAVFVTNREAEFGLFKKRRDAMLGRVAELNKYLDEMKIKR